MGTVRQIRRYGPLVALILVAGASWQAAELADVDDERVEAIAYERELRTPLLSARRVPLALQTPLADDALGPAVTTFWNGASPDTCVQVTVAGRAVASTNPQLGVVPASNQKMLTTFAALAVFGPDHVFTTTVATAQTPTDGVVAGDLYLIGGGDPFLSTESWISQYDEREGRYHSRLEDLADSVAAQGITTIEGAVLGDESYFDTVRYGPWPQRHLESRQSGPLSALGVNEGFVSWPSTFQQTARPRVPSEQPARSAAATFTELLRARGITVVGEPGDATAPVERSVIATLDSVPLSDIATHVNSFSNNYGAEMLVKHLGRSRAGIGSLDAGVQVIHDVLSMSGIDTTGLVVADGSGLSEDNRLTCQILTDLMITAQPHSVFADSLSIAGERGSIAGRFAESPAAGYVYAKTGTLNNSAALSGYVYPPHDDTLWLSFSYVANGETIGLSTELRESERPFVEALARYPEAPSLAELGPHPAGLTPAIDTAGESE